MKSIFIKMNSITDITSLVKEASAVDGEIEIRKGRWCVDGSSLMGVMSLDMSTGATIIYPDDAEKFENFVKKFEA